MRWQFATSSWWGDGARRCSWLDGRARIWASKRTAFLVQRGPPLGHRRLRMTASRVDRAFARFRKSGDPRALAKVFDATAGELYRLG